MVSGNQVKRRAIVRGQRDNFIAVSHYGNRDQESALAIYMDSGDFTGVDRLATQGRKQKQCSEEAEEHTVTP